MLGVAAGARLRLYSFECLIFSSFRKKEKEGGGISLSVGAVQSQTKAISSALFEAGWLRSPGPQADFLLPQYLKSPPAGGRGGGGRWIQLQMR